QLGGGFVAGYYCDAQPPASLLIEGLRNMQPGLRLVVVRCSDSAQLSGIPAGVADFTDVEGPFQQRYDATPGSLSLVRPHQHLTARWRDPNLDAVRTSLARAACLAEAQPA